jgi:hypothetical protein
MHRPRVRFSFARRLVALLIAVCVASSALEGLVPDVHDGDAPAGQVAASDQGRRSAASAEHAATIQVADTPSHDGTLPAPHGAPEPSHPLHADHCTHGHVAAPPVVFDAAPATIPHPDVPRSVSLTFASVRLPLHLRPPIA